MCVVLCSITFVKFPDDSPLSSETCSDIQCDIISYVSKEQVLHFVSLVSWISYRQCVEWATQNVLTQDLCFIHTTDVHFIKITVKRAETCWDYRLNFKLYTIVQCVLLILSSVITGNRSFIKYNSYLKCNWYFKLKLSWHKM